MANLSSVDFSTGVLSSATTGTVMTLNAVAAAAGTPAANALTVQNSSVAFNVTVSSGTIASLSSGLVRVSSVAGGTIAVSSLAGGTVTSLSSGLVAIANGANVAAVKASITPAASTDPALVVAISPNSPLTATSASNSVFKIQSIDGTNATNIKAASATLFGAQLYNNGSSTIFLKLYNSSIAPTAGSSQFFLNIGIPPGLAINPKFTSILSSLGLGYTITGGIGSTSTAAISSDDLIGSIEYA